MIELELIDVCHSDLFQGSNETVVAVPFLYSSSLEDCIEAIKDELRADYDVKNDLNPTNLSDTAQDMLHEFSNVSDNSDSEDDNEFIDVYAYIIVVEKSLLPEWLVTDFIERANCERANNGYCWINFGLPEVEVGLSDGSIYHFQESEAQELLDEVPENISEDDYLLAISQGW